MASIINGYEYDIFISYRHKDNKGDHWVSEFVKALRAELEATFKEDISIYFDTNPHDGLLETHNVDKSLEGKLKCLIFIPIISQTYCDPKSFAWQHEFCAFNQQAKDGQIGRDVRLGNGNVASRILPVKIHDLDTGDKSIIENEIGGVIRAVEFIYKEPGVNRPLKLTDSKSDNQNKTDYRNQLNKVANAAKEIITALKTPTTQATQATPPHQTKSKINRKPLVAILSMILVAAVAAYFFYPTLIPAAQEIKLLDKSIAVLPFTDMSPLKDQEYLADGIAEDIITALSRITELKVIGRTSSFQFKGEKIDLRDVGEKLNVSTVLEGSIMKAGNKVRITAQLINVSDGTHIWSERYDKDMDDIFAIQDEISKAISDKMKISLLGKTQSSKERRTANTEAYESYLRGQQILDPAEGRAARPFFEKAIQLDSSYADAYYGLARSYYFDWQMSRAERGERVLPLAHKIRELDPASEKSYDLLYTVYGTIRWEWKSAEEEYQKYQAITPIPFVGHALNLAELQGDLKGGIEEMVLALDADPINKTVLRLLSRLYASDHQFAKSKEMINKALEIDPYFALGYRTLAHVSILEGDYTSALESLTMAEKLDPSLPTREFAIWALVKANRIKEAKEYYAGSVSSSRIQWESLATKARVEFWMGNLDDGFRLLEESLAVKDYDLLTVRYSPQWDVIRDHPRFVEFIKKVSFPPNH